MYLKITTSIKNYIRHLKSYHFFFSFRFSNEGCTRFIVMLNLILALKFQAFKSIKLCIFFLKIKDWDTFCFIHLRVE